MSKARSLRITFDIPSNLYHTKTFANLQSPIKSIIFVPTNTLMQMVITFEKEYLRDLYQKGTTPDKKYRFQPEIIKNYIRRIKTLEKIEKIEELFRINSLKYEVLKGDKKGISSIRVNDQYRIEFTVTDRDSEPVITVCNILELSNHYK